MNQEIKLILESQKMLLQIALNNNPNQKGEIEELIMRIDCELEIQ